MQPQDIPPIRPAPPWFYALVIFLFSLCTACVMTALVAFAAWLLELTPKVVPAAFGLTFAATGLALSLGMPRDE